MFVESAVRNANGGRTPTDAQAVRHHELAVQQLASARQHARAGDTRQASRLLARAEADLELSALLERRARASADARRYEQQLERTRRGDVRTTGESR